MTNKSAISIEITYDTFWVKLWQPGRGGTPGLHSVSKDIYILAVTCSSGVSLNSDIFLNELVPLSPRTTGYVGNGAHLLSAAA